MSPARLPPLLLMRRQSSQASTAERWALASVSLVIFAGLLGMFLLLFEFDPDALAKGFERLPGKLRDSPVDLLKLVILPLSIVALLWYKRRATRYERVFLDGTGIRYQSPLPEALRFLQPSWSLQWSHLRELRIGLPGAAANPGLVFLQFDAGAVKRKLFALYWVPADPAAQAHLPEAPPRRPFFSLRLSAFDREGVLREAEQSAIVRYARQVGVKVATGGMRPAGFALESNRHALAAAIFAISLLLYGFSDIWFYEESYAVDPPFVLFALGGALAVLAGMVWLASARVPRAETLGVSLLLGVATGIALYPGALRLNEATDSQGLHTYEYRLKEYAVFVPADPALPTLDFSNYSNYWRQFKLGTTHSFELRKGGLGFYQVNMAPVNQRMRDNYWARK
jgi:hypothetical protein